MRNRNRLRDDRGLVVMVPRREFPGHLFLRPELERRICAEPPGAARVLAVMSPYSTLWERGQLSDLLDRTYEKTGVLQSGAEKIVDYRRR